MPNDATGEIRRAAIRALPILGKDPAAVFATLAELIRHHDQVAAAAGAISKLPESARAKDPALVNSLVEWARAVPPDQRTTPEYLATLRVANQLAASLPAPGAAAAAAALANLDVSVFTIKTVREQLRYDTARLVVEAGKPFEVTFENPDAMPHNLVFVTPGTLQDVAIAVQTQAPDKLDAKGRAYVPENDPRILGATKLVEAGKSETLHLTAPANEGTYQYVCTFPGHWAVMKGELIVTKGRESLAGGAPGEMTFTGAPSPDSDPAGVRDRASPRLGSPAPHSQGPPLTSGEIAPGHPGNRHIYPLKKSTLAAGKPPLPSRKSARALIKKCTVTAVQWTLTVRKCADTSVQWTRTVRKCTVTLRKTAPDTRETTPGKPIHNSTKSRNAPVHKPLRKATHSGRSRPKKTGTNGRIGTAKTAKSAKKTQMAPFELSLPFPTIAISHLFPLALLASWR